MGLDDAGVEHHDITGIPVDDTLRTSNPDIYAVGDVTGKFPLVHVAIQQGEIAGRNAATGARERVDYALSKTHTVFTDPQVAIVGETERELEAAGHRVRPRVVSVQRPRQSRRAREDQGLREDDGVAARRAHPRRGDPRARTRPI